MLATDRQGHTGAHPTVQSSGGTSKAIADRDQHPGQPRIWPSRAPPGTFRLASVGAPDRLPPSWQPEPSFFTPQGWRPLLTTPSHPEYPAAHGVITSAMAEVFSSFLGTNQIGLDLGGFDAAGPAGHLDAVRHYDMPKDLRQEIIDARPWAGLHYRFSGVAGVVLGRKVAKYDLKHAFHPVA
jgi:hypothetical protein